VLLPLKPSQALSIRRRLLASYDGQRRDLPWRRSRDPYRILVSEVMLQQTTVAAVIPYYHRFIERFPDLTALAESTEQEVLAAWSGLGYYRRARALREACRRTVQEHGGRLPRSVEVLRSLPGIGPYTAGAVASIAFGKQEPVLDGNVVRVLARLAARPGRGAAELRLLEQAARRLVAGERPGDLNQALMELGATVCTPRQPNCKACPVSRSCSALRQGHPEEYPHPVKRPSMVRRSGVALVIRNARGGILLVQRGAGQLMPGLWELPGLTGQEREDVIPSPDLVARQAGCQVGRHVDLGRSLGTFSHTVVNRKVQVEVREGVLKEKGSAGKGPERLLQIVQPGHDALPALTSAARKALAVAGLPPHAWTTKGTGR
jgi:A/G-specific adenine glycosylase